MTQPILVSTTEGVTTITLHRPEKRNAMNGEMIRTLLDALHHLAHDSKSHLLLINGNGEHFCAGADIAWMQQISMGSSDENYKDAQFLADLMYALYSFPKPTIVLAHGTTMGGGLGLLAACDIALAADNAVFAFSEVKIGIAPSIVSPYVMAAIGERMAHYYFLTAERFNAQKALQMNLIHQAVESSGLISVGIMLANSLLKNGPQALIAAKQLIRRVAKEKISEELAQKTAEHLAHLRASHEAQEGLKAFLEKREPQWK